MQLQRLTREIPMDTLTPLSAWLRLRQTAQPGFLFESAGSDLSQARYSILGFAPDEILTLQAGVLSRQTTQGREILPGHPLETLKAKLQAEKMLTDPSLPPFTGGYVGYLGYDCVQYLEKIPLPAEASPLPEACLMRFARVLVFDHLKRKILLVAHLPLEASAAELNRAQTDLQILQAQLRHPVAAEALLELPDPPPAEPPLGRMGEAAFCEKVSQLQEAIAEGEIFQAVLSEQFRTPLEGDPFTLYRILRSLNPSPYLYYLDMGGPVLLGTSPEMLVKSNGSEAATCPIAGTRRRGHTPAEDQALAQELIADEKERAEHLMLVDLGRNDLGRVSQPGSVEVSRYMELEYFSHVMHLVSLVEGQLAEGKTALDALFACFPAGTLSGAPKIRAMELLGQLEPVRRGWYGGAVFYHGFEGQLDACITIRSLAIHQGEAILQAGAGVVADSIPRQEYLEVRNKARVLFQALQSANALATQTPTGAMA
ncbi:anthranilate synthase component I [bacterium (Candidatus Blackallbacteria) CG17_big_fil_post_rev_8_21_14_2_50_48_46]|uniref:Anthranilate synthase component 1 n=1 Tax=bacterium (Candidatus Blackallbacteria) CG17_big_fil_post_rev_8_21_14_2_50_48_46 TaxID=2014261 RepID=A0A2M7FZK0_9BACT|nr:MAG: anthranilate synthase component I [bacterium (Candidatus Blackallbacteria) CG18_big_fil_WC_8_21_14_2_50_49_26]PIW14303.1 MAG: anthranilate synthase component I [bacterium (Candidatus Blackallbacteria) CG17_big_fil_post_rev_8_21_14_2_50_48_46]PIW45572.1 MAG: anthranilate synthase component I [bacterium (Candidatus Blackallbacteria) CG13_big_fil_rev_8_21_14_2_50_49_14]